MDNSVNSNLSNEEKYNSLSSSAYEYSNKNDFLKAIELYKQALVYKPNQIQAMGELCWCLGQVDKVDEMLEYAKKALVIAQKRASKDNIGRFYFYIAQYYKVKGTENKQLYREYEFLNDYLESKKYGEIATKYLNLACNYFDLSIANKPYFLSNYLDKAICKSLLDNYEEALDLLEYIEEKDEEFAKEKKIEAIKIDSWVNGQTKKREFIYIKLGLEYEKRKKLKEANKNFNIAIERNPKSILGLFFLFQNEFKLNEDTYKTISIGEYLFSLLNKKENKKDSPFFLEKLCTNLAKCYENIGNSYKFEYHKTESKYNSYLVIARKANEEKEYEKAFDEYKKAFEIHNNDYDFLIEMIDLCFSMNKLDEAMDYSVIGLKEAKDNNENDYLAKFQYYMGCRLDESNYDKAVNFYEDALKTTTNINDKLMYCRKIAFFYCNKGQVEIALEYFNKCKNFISSGANDVFDIDSEIIKLQELQNKDSDLSKMNEHFNVGAKYFNEMNFEEAAKEMEAALSYIPQDLESMDVLSRSLYRIKQYDKCYDVAYEGYLTSLRDHDYRFLDMFCYNLGNILYNSGEPEKALKYYKYALNIKPYDTDYLYFVAACHRNLGDFAEALRLFSIANKIDPEDKGIKEQLAFCMNKLNL